MLDDVPVLSQLAVLQPVDVTDFVDMAVVQRALEEDIDYVVPHEPVNVAVISSAEDLIVELLYQGLTGCRFSLAYHELPLSACS